MKKATKRLAEIIGVRSQYLDNLLTHAEHPKYSEKQVEAAVNKLDEYEPFYRMSIVGSASDAAACTALNFWHRIAKQKNGIADGNLLTFALTARPPVMEIRITEHELGRELTAAELDEWIDTYRHVLFENSRYFYDAPCSLCGKYNRLATCRICGTEYCEECITLGPCLSTYLVCKNCVGKLPKGW